MLLEIVDTRDQAESKICGRLIAHWEIETAIEYLREVLFNSWRDGIADAREAGENIEPGSEEAIRKHVEKEIQSILNFIDQHAAQTFALLQMKLITDAAWFVEEKRIGRKAVTENREEIAAMFKKHLNERMGIQRGREKGKKISTPGKALKYREQILTAIQKVYDDDPLRDPAQNEVAAKIDITDRALRHWLKAIKKETREDWGDLLSAIKRKE